MKKILLIGILSLLSVIPIMAEETSNNVPRNTRPEKKFCFYLDKKDGKDLGLTINIPQSFHKGIRSKEHPDSVVFISGDDPPENWLLMKENISVCECSTIKFEELVYGNCMQLFKCGDLDTIFDHGVTFKREEKIPTATVFFDRVAFSYNIGGELFMGPRNYELLFLKVYQAKDNLIAVQYVKKYDINIKEEDKKQIIEKMKHYLSENVIVSDFNGKIKKPDKKAKIVLDPVAEMLREKLSNLK